MKLNLFQRLLVLLVFLCMRVIQFVELTTSNLAAKSYVTVTSLSFLLIVGFGMYTGFFSSVSDGVLAAHANELTSLIPENVLGAKISKTEKEYPARLNEEPAPILTAKAALVVDRTNNKILYEKNSSEKLAPASTTKLMTALVALDMYELTNELTITENCFNVDSTKVGAPVDSVYTVEDAIKGMLIASSGDLACELSSNKVSPDEFVYRMNVKARNLGMHNTLFSNAVGLDGDSGSNFSTASDLYLLTQAALKEDTITEAIATKEYILKSTDGSFIGKLENTNRLLFEIAYSKGVKTGKTTEAGEVLIYEFDDQQKDLVIIVMGSEERFSDVRALLYWTLSTFNWEKS